MADEGPEVMTFQSKSLVLSRVKLAPRFQIARRTWTAEKSIYVLPSRWPAGYGLFSINSTVSSVCIRWVAVPLTRLPLVVELLVAGSGVTSR